MLQRQENTLRALRACVATALFVVVIVGVPAGSGAGTTSTSTTEEPPGFLGVVGKSIAGDVYEPSRWRALELGSLFSDGWDEAWSSGPNGAGGAPRQGWLNAQDGVFYRLFLFTFNTAHQDGNDSYAGGLTVYTPLNRRFQLRWDVPFVVSTPDGTDHETGFGDFQITPRLLLSETENFSQSLDLTFRTPTGSARTGNGVGAFSPWYNFWYNAVGGLVLRGGLGGFVPYENDVSDSFNANLAAGYYFTRHDLLPIGDLVGYVSANLTQLADADASTTTLTLTPGFRTHLGANFYLLGGVEVPVTDPKPFDYQVLGALMKVW